MRQFEVFDNPSSESKAFAPYVLVLQSHHLGDLDTIIVAPIIRDADRPLSPVDIAIDVDGEKLIVAISELGAVEARRLRRRITDAAGIESEIRRALDRLFTGF